MEETIKKLRELGVNENIIKGYVDRDRRIGNLLNEIDNIKKKAKDIEDRLRA
jgi:hypothetical protein